MYEFQYRSVFTFTRKALGVLLQLQAAIWAHIN